MTETRWQKMRLFELFALTGWGSCHYKQFHSDRSAEHSCTGELPRNNRCTPACSPHRHLFVTCTQHLPALADFIIHVLLNVLMQSSLLAATQTFITLHNRCTYKTSRTKLPNAHLVTATTSPNINYRYLSQLFNMHARQIFDNVIIQNSTT